MSQFIIDCSAVAIIEQRVSKVLAAPDYTSPQMLAKGPLRVYGDCGCGAGGTCANSCVSNLNCKYCYEKNKSLRTMSLETALSIVEEELMKDDGFDICEIQFLGGEPFFEFNLIRNICDFIWTHNGHFGTILC